MQAAADASGHIDWDGAALVATHVKAQRSAAGARKILPPTEKRGRNRRVVGAFAGGFTSKIHLCVDGHGSPLSFVVTAGQCSDAANIGTVLDAISVPRSGQGRQPNVRPAYGSTGHMARVLIGGRYSSAESAAFAPNGLMRRRVACAKVAGEDLHRASMPRRTRDATSSNERSTD
jgi:hypothetical protein